MVQWYTYIICDIDRYIHTVYMIIYDIYIYTYTQRVVVYEERIRFLIVLDGWSVRIAMLQLKWSMKQVMKSWNDDSAVNYIHLLLPDLSKDVGQDGCLFICCSILSPCEYGGMVEIY